MNRIPRWSIWAGLTVVAWLIWGVWLHSSMTRGLDSLREKRDSSSQKLQSLQARVAQVPALVARLDTTLNDLKSDFEQYHSLKSLDDLMKTLTADARRCGVQNASAGPDLESVLELDASPPNTTVGQIHCDTLLVELSATNDYRRIGRWLDMVEKRPDFQHWVGCSWSTAGTDELIRFDGLVAILVTDDETAPAMNAEVTGGG